MMKNLGKVGVLQGGISAEREVSLMSGGGVLAALQSKGVDAHAFDPAERSLAALAEEKFDRVFIALHGRYGEDGSIQGALEQLQIPYTGSGVKASSVAMDKALTKKIWQASGISTPRYQKIDAQTDFSALIADLGLPLIVKPAHEGSSLGLTKVFQAEDLPAAYEKASQSDTSVIAEEFISGMELTCAILEMDGEPEALPLVSITAPEANYDYQTKYFSDEVIYQCPVDLPADIDKAIREMALESYRAIGCRGWARVDVMLRESDQQFFLLEINTSPGMTSHSLVPMAAKANGMDYASLCVHILSRAGLELKSTQMCQKG